MTSMTTRTRAIDRISQKASATFDYINRRLSTRAFLSDEATDIEVTCSTDHIKWNQIGKSGIYTKPVTSDLGDHKQLIMRGNAGSKLGLHKHTSQNEMTIVTKGSILDIGSNITYSKGEIVRYRAGEPHDFEILEDNTVLICCFDPKE